MTGAPVLTTERLVLRPHRAGDLDAIAAMTGDPLVMRGIGGLAQSREDSWRRMMSGVGSWALLGFGYWVIERRSDGQLLGQLGLTDFKRDVEPRIEDVPELGYALGAAAHGAGYASEAVAAVLQWADAMLQADQVVAIVDPDNIRSIRVLEKAGFGAAGAATYKDAPVLLFRRFRPSSRRVSEPRAPRLGAARRSRSERRFPVRCLAPTSFRDG